MNYKIVILNKLLDKYEKSKSYLNEVNRRILIKAGSISEYNVEKYDEKQVFHDTVKDLKNRGLIDFSWEKFEEGNILKEIWLNKEKVDEAYQEIKRENPKDSYKQILLLLEAQQYRKEWLTNFKNETINEMISTEKECSYLPKEKAEDILKALKELDKIEITAENDVVLKRVFSIRCYNDSKYFERNIEKNLIAIIKKFYKSQYFETCSEKNSDISLEKNKKDTNVDFSTMKDYEILAEVGIVKSPEVIEFCGNMKCKIKNEEIEFKDITLGNYINSFSILNLNEIELVNVQKIIFIENKTNYINYIQNKKENEFVIYHGGVYSPVKGEFFRKIYEASKKINGDIKYYHWSDIDIGGFNIFVRLKENIVKELEPYKMDKSVLLQNEKNWQPISDDYKQKLMNLRGLEKYNLFFEVIDFMVENGVKLEQESLIG